MRDEMVDQNMGRWVEGGPCKEGDHPTDVAEP